MLEHGERLDLSGTWDFLPGALRAENLFDHLRADSPLPWARITVPSCWNGARWMSIVGEPHATAGFPPGDPALRDRRVGWYRTSFAVPPAWRNRRVHVRFLAVAARAEVWLNGSFVGQHLGAYSSFTFDLTGHLDPSAENRLVARVHGKSCFYPGDERRFDQGGIHLFVPGRSVEIPVGESRDNAGIWQPVELFATGPAYVEDVEAQAELVETWSPDLRCEGRLTVRIPIARGSEQRRPVDVTLALVERGTEREVWRQTKRTHLPGKRTLLTFRWQSLEVASWSPGSPTLYELRFEVAQDGETWQTGRLQVGFRRFEIRDGTFRLNGEPCFLRGAGTPPHPLIPNDGSYIRRFLSLCKEANLNCIRFHTEPPSQAWMDGCDRAGLLVLYEFPLMQQAPESCATRREIRELVRQARHHPCLAIYCLSNETDFLETDFPPGMAGMAGYPSMSEYLSDLREAVLEEDATLPVYHNAGYTHGEDGDVRDWHIYGGWYDNCLYSFEAIMRGQAMMEALSPREGVFMAPGGLVDRRNRKFRLDAHKPVILSEFVAAYTADDGHLLQYPLRIRRIGRSPDPGNARSLWFQAFLLRETVEILRRARDGANRLCGIMPFALFNWFSHPLELDRLEPKPAFAALRDTMEPLHIGIRCWSRHRFATDPLAAELFLIHDDLMRPCVPDGELAWRLIADVGDRLLAEGRLAAPQVLHCQIVTVPLRILLPDIAGDRIVPARLEVEWRANDEVVSRNAVELLLAPAGLRLPAPGSPSAPPSPARVWVVDTGERTALVLARMGIASHCCRELPTSPDGLDLLIVGPDMLPQLGSGDTARLREAARAGLTVLVLEQDIYDPNRPPIVIDWLDGLLLRIMREEDHVDDFVYLPDPGAPIFDGLLPEHFRMWNGNTVLVSSYIRQGDESNHRPAKTRFGARSGYRVRKLTGVRSWAECFNFLRNDALVEVPLGSGRVVFSQIEATRRFGDDPVATVYLRNLVRYCLGSADGKSRAAVARGSPEFPSQSGPSIH